MRDDYYLLDYMDNKEPNKRVISIMQRAIVATTIGTLATAVYWYFALVSARASLVRSTRSDCLGSLCGDFGVPLNLNREVQWGFLGLPISPQISFAMGLLIPLVTAFIFGKLSSKRLFWQVLVGQLLMLAIPCYLIFVYLF